MELLNAHAKAAVACMWLQNDIEGKFVTAGHWESGLAEYFHSLRNIQKLVSKLISVLSFLLFVKISCHWPRELFIQFEIL